MPTIRAYRHEDWANYLALDLETGLAGTLVPDAERARFEQTWPQTLREKYSFDEGGPGSGQGDLFVLESEEGSYLGHIWLTEQSDLFTQQRALFITTVAIVQSARGRGHGQELMAFAEQEARRRGLSRLELGASADNTGAVRLYERLGFVTTRVRMRKELDGETRS